MINLINNDLLGYVHHTLFVLLTLFNELGHTRLKIIRYHFKDVMLTISVFT